MTTTIVLLHGAALNGRMWDPGLAAGMTRAGTYPTGALMAVLGAGRLLAKTGAGAVC